MLDLNKRSNLAEKLIRHLNVPAEQRDKLWDVLGTITEGQCKRFHALMINNDNSELERFISELTYRYVSATK